MREPGGTKESEKIRNLILKNSSKFNPVTDLLLYLAARSENIEKNIKTNFKKKVIIIDRFVDSTLAYQHYGMGINKEIIIKINKLLIKNLKIDHTFLHTVNIDNSKKRVKMRKNINRYDKFSKKFYQKVQKGFLKLAKKNKKNYTIINSDYPLDHNKKIIIKKLEKLII